MDKTRAIMLGIFTAVALCKYTQAEWNTTKAPNSTVSCDPHDDSRNCTDSKDDHRWSGHFSKCPQEYIHYCINGACRFVKEQNTPSCRCESGYIGTRCEYHDLSFQVEEHKKIVIACVVTGLIFLILLVVFICFCTNKRYKPCRKRRKKKEERDEVEKLNSLNINESLCVPVDASDTNTV